ncbi:MAG: galactose ABC transporter substrate-binding protein, partial [Deltaproteobacteria bacterium]|nr:galactose ABC transporter substrate-binding protein [Deltaproteobacteria bacterium]
VFFNREPDLNSIKAYSNARFVGTDAFDAGVMQGDIIQSLWERHPEYDRNGDGQCQYVMIQANIDNPEAVARTEYSVRQAREKGVVMQQVGETLFCGWDETMAYDAMSLLFPLYADTVELVISNNDSMALGAIRVMQEYGYNLEGGDPAKFIPVVGVDAIPQAAEAIRKGIMSATVAQDDKAMGSAIGTMLLNVLAGKDYLEGMSYPWDASGIAIRIPYSRFSGHN